MTARARIHIGQVPLDPLTLEDAVERIVELAESGRGGTVYTPNVDHVVVAEKNTAFREAYSEVSLSLVDGAPVLWASRLLGRGAPEKVSGSDLFEPLVARAAQLGLPVYLLGGKPGVAELASRSLIDRHPALTVAGIRAPHIDGSGTAEDESALIEELRTTAPALVFVACGAPKSELFAHRVRTLLGSAVFVCVGAAIDFAAGTARRAPRWMSRVGLEWAYRLFREPRRLARRYLLRDPKFFWIFTKQLGSVWGEALRSRVLGPKRAPLSDLPAGEFFPPSQVRRITNVDFDEAQAQSEFLPRRTAGEPVVESGVTGDVEAPNKRTLPPG